MSLSRFYPKQYSSSPSLSRFYPYFPRPRPGFIPHVPVPVLVLPHPHVYSKRFVQDERLSTRAQYNNQYRIPTQLVIA